MAKKLEPPGKPITWTIYRAVAKAIWLGTIEATDKDTAIQKGAQEFKTDAWRLRPSSLRRRRAPPSDPMLAAIEAHRVAGEALNDGVEHADPLSPGRKRMS
jgi:hypothetical protein